MSLSSRWLLLLSFLFMIPAEAARTCRQSQNHTQPVIFRQATDDTYTATEKDLVQGTMYLAEAELSLTGVLTLDMSLRTEQGEHSQILRGKDEFNRILRHFGTDVRKIRAQWFPGSDNHTAYLRLATQLGPLEAAAQTWTGIQARAAGFRHIRQVYDSKNPQAVFFEFSKP
jgi:hypothetical protein